MVIIIQNRFKMQSLRDAKLMEIETFNANSIIHQSMANKYFAACKTKNEELHDKVFLTSNFYIYK